MRSKTEIENADICVRLKSVYFLYFRRNGKQTNIKKKNDYLIGHNRNKGFEVFGDESCFYLPSKKYNPTKYAFCVPESETGQYLA